MQMIRKKMRKKRLRLTRKLKDLRVISETSSIDTRRCNASKVILKFEGLYFFSYEA